MGGGTPGEASNLTLALRRKRIRFIHTRNKEETKRLLCVAGHNGALQKVRGGVHRKRADVKPGLFQHLHARIQQSPMCNGCCRADEVTAETPVAVVKTRFDKRHTLAAASLICMVTAVLSTAPERELAG